MEPPPSLEVPVDKHDIPKVTKHIKPMPFVWRIGILAVIFGVAIAAYVFREIIGVRGQSVAGIIFFIGLVAAFSSNLRAVNWNTIFWGMVLQAVFAVLVLKVDIVRNGFQGLGNAVGAFMDFSDKGAQFVFGILANPKELGKIVGPENQMIFAFKALPPILFISAFFTVLYHFGILQLIVRGMAVVMTFLMRTSGAETLSVAANVFMGQTEAPLIVKPYVPSMTNSELFVLMVSGMAHISGGLMVVYIGFGASAVAVLTAVVMACPASMYLAKLFLPEVSTPITGGGVPYKKEPSPYVNAIDAAATGTTLGLQLALNVAAMLIVFVAFVAGFDYLLGLLHYPLEWVGLISATNTPDWLKDMSLGKVFGWIFSPMAFLMGVPEADIGHVGNLLGFKLSINEFYAFLKMVAWKGTPGFMSERSYLLAAFALTGFANFSSVGIQLGGIGSIAPNRRADLARLGLRALFVGFTTSLLNASIAGAFLPA